MILLKLTMATKKIRMAITFLESILRMVTGTRLAALEAMAVWALKVQAT
jgi:hypothetical protein